MPRALAAHEPCGVLLRHAQRVVAQVRLLLDDGEQLLRREAREALLERFDTEPLADFSAK